MAGGGNQEENPVAINVVAMVDIIFCLCLFFMCSLKFKPLDAKFDSYLPKDKGNRPATNVNEVKDEIRVILSWNKEANKLERLFGQRQVPPSDEGNEILTGLIREANGSYRARGVTEAPLIIDAGPLVPWHFVVQVMDLAKDAGVQKLEFATGTQFQ